MKIQIVVPVINLWSRYTKPCIDSINEAMVRAKTHGIDTRLLLIDNASTDETKVEAGKMVSSVFAHHRNEERWGFQKSVNFGVNDAFERGFDIVLVCNNDIIIHPEAIWRIAGRFEKDDGSLGMVTCMDVRGYMDEKGITPQNISQLVAHDYESVDEAPHPNFSAFAINKVCWERVGEFDEVFEPAYFEDNCYHYRTKLAEVGAIVYPPALFYHYGSRTQNEASENGTPMVPSPLFQNNRAFYIKKWGGAPGEEKYTTPYDDTNKTIKSTKQG